MMARMQSGGARVACFLLLLGACSTGESAEHNPARAPARANAAPSAPSSASSMAPTPGAVSTTPYSTRTVTAGELADFFAKNREYRPDSAAITAFYAQRGMQYGWILGDRVSAEAESFVSMAGIADPNVPHATAGTRRIAALYEQGFEEGEPTSLCAACGTELELRITAEFYRLARDPHEVYLNKDRRDLNWFIPRAKNDFARVLDSARAGKFGSSAAEPAHAQYRLLRTQLQTYAKLANEPWPTISFGGRRHLARPQDTSSVIPDVRHRLVMLGDFDRDTSSTRYDSALVRGVKRFQRRLGVKDDGIVGDATLKALNVSPTENARTLLVNMERLRWVSPQQALNLLLVNIPEFRLHVFEENKEVMAMDVVVGKRANRTVTFTDTLTQIVFNPTWSIPASIVKKEILPAMDKDHDYLSTHQMEMTKERGSDVPSIKQLPGPTNPLGRVKFLFPNSHDIYMHDTPAKGLFANDSRADSHGCIRLSRAADLAGYLLEDDPQWTPDRIREAMSSGTEQAVKLAFPRPVAIVYFTAWVDASGELNLRDDVYGHDAALAGDLFGSTVPAKMVSASATRDSARGSR
ncbi:MAG TPA: L,D-transpeptidase family protein [Gemmatimonadaceae bacterium]|nr:L,D-transpeptidase family protein [Gemmatimonadaceae bacterium]